MIKQIEGKWTVIEKTNDDKNLLDNKIKGIFQTANCDSIQFERTYHAEISYTFFEDETYTHIINEVITYLDTTATRLACAAVYKDSLLGDTIRGGWQLDGKSSVVLVVNKDYASNALLDLTDKTMSCETNLVVANSIVSFNGSIITKFKKD